MEKRDNKGTVILINGISSSGKTTLSLLLKEFLEKEKKRKVQIIDGNSSREFFGNDLGYSEDERFMSFKRNIYAAYLLADKGLDVILAFSLFKKQSRDFINNKLPFIEIFLNPDVEDCIKNDFKGVYKKNLKLDKPNMPGVDIPFQKPENPDLVVITHKETPEESFKKIVQFFNKEN